MSTNKDNKAPTPLKKIEFRLKEAYKSKSVIKVKRGGVRQVIPIQVIQQQPVKALYEWQIDYVFENTPEELTEVIRRVDEKKGLTKKVGYQTRKLRAVQSVDSAYDVL